METETIYTNGNWTGTREDFDYLATDDDGNAIIRNQVDDGECFVVEDAT